MRTRTKVLLALLLLPGPLAEIISTNMPVFNLLRLPAWIGLVLIYGCGTLLIREAKIRWGMQWSVVFIAIAYGIFEEGLVTQAFFNPQWFNTPSYWMAYGVQWGWTLILLVFHASLSTLIPIYIVSRLWPEHENKRLLGNRGTAVVIAGTLAGIGLGMNIFAGPMGPGGFFAAPELLIAGMISIILLALLSYKLRKSRIVIGRGLMPYPAIAASSFIFQGLNSIVPPALAGSGMGVWPGIAIQLFIIALFSLFSASQLLNKGTGKKHVISFVWGAILWWMLVGILRGINPAEGRIELLAVVPVAFVLLMAWCRLAVKK